MSNLPPGCTDADIDRAMGGDEGATCWFCHTTFSQDEIEADPDILESVWWKGRTRVACSPCAAKAEDY
jgi:hypothetical protein